MFCYLVFLFISSFLKIGYSLVDIHLFSVAECNDEGILK